jgi:hypothetical protein
MMGQHRYYWGHISCCRARHLLVAFAFSPYQQPYRPGEAGGNIYYDTFSEEPKHLDPALLLLR